MTLKIGSKAIDFTLCSKTSHNLVRYTLSQNFGQKNTVLLFFPMAFTSVCTTQMCDVSLHQDKWHELKACVWGVSGDNPFAQEAWALKEKISIPLLSDYEHEICEKYGVAYKSFLPEKNLGLKGVCKRAAFVIDKQGIIRYMEVSDDPGKVPSMKKIEETLQSIQ